MNFISYDFLIFWGCVISLYIVLNHSWQNRMLLLASYIFYGWWDYRFLSLIIISSVADFICAQLADPQRQPGSSDTVRKLAVLVSVLINLTILGFFKYFNFFIESGLTMLQWFGLPQHSFHLELVLPVGISFYTFQTMSYTIDVYRGKLHSTSRFWDFLLYVSFFPQLVAGPIERGRHLLPQILAERQLSWLKMTSGCQLALWGFFKKMVIADNLSVLVNNVFIQSTPSGAMVLIAVYAFAFQIYCDFSGYTDIARGVARMLGFEICVNFRLPYFATNPSDFWRRWHISLSSWLRDYLYIPLGGNRKGLKRTYVNLLITMLLGGLWHGAAWNFIIWGAFHGGILIIQRLSGQFKKGTYTVSTVSPLKQVLKVGLFFHITCFGWLIFRVESVQQLLAYIQALVMNFQISQLWSGALLQVIVLVGPLIVFQFYQSFSGRMEPWQTWPDIIKVPFYLFLIYAIILLGSPVKEAFIYFQF